MTDDTGMPASADALQTTDLATLLAEVARLVGEVEQLVAGTERATPERASAIADQQAAIVAAAHEEAAAILAAAHAAAARILDRASRGERSPEGGPLAAPPGTEAVVDLRDATLGASPPVEPAPAHQAPPPPPAAPAPSQVEDTSPAVDEVAHADADLRASHAAAIDMARCLSQRIEQLSRELHESSNP